MTFYLNLYLIKGGFLKGSFERSSVISGWVNSTGTSGLTVGFGLFWWPLFLLAIIFDFTLGVTLGNGLLVVVVTLIGIAVEAKNSN